MDIHLVKIQLFYVVHFYKEIMCIYNTILFVILRKLVNTVDNFDIFLSSEPYHSFNILSSIGKSNAIYYFAVAANVDAKIVFVVVSIHHYYRGLPNSDDFHL